MVTLDIVIKANKFFLIGPCITDNYFVRIDILHYSITFSGDKYPAILDYSLFQSGSDNRGLRTHKRNSLAHHI